MPVHIMDASNAQVSGKLYEYGWRKIKVKLVAYSTAVYNLNCNSRSLDWSEMWVSLRLFVRGATHLLTCRSDWFIADWIVVRVGRRSSIYQVSDIMWVIWGRALTGTCQTTWQKRKRLDHQLRWRARTHRGRGRTLSLYHEFVSAKRIIRRACAPKNV